MELSLKMPEGKPPFIGIVFTSVREASTLNEDLINSPVDDIYTLILLNMHDGEVDIRIGSDNKKHLVTYRNVKCSFTQVENFLFINRTCQDFNFGHVLRDFGRDTIVCTRERYKPFVLKIKGVFLLA